MKMIVKVKKLHPDAVIPKYAYGGDACFDLVAVSRTWNEHYGFWEYGTGLAFEVPKGYKGSIVPRSSISKYDLVLCNSRGIIDEKYRGEISFRFKVVGNVPPLEANIYNIGDRIGQMEFEKVNRVEEFIVVDDLEKTERNDGGYGSSGR